MTAKLYDETDTNPLAGCLPSFLQLPLLIALYRSVLNLAKEKQLEEPFYWLPSLEGPTITPQLQLPEGRGLQWLTDNWEPSWADAQWGDPTTLPIPILGWEDTLAYCAVPLALVLVNFGVQKLNPLPETAEGEQAAAGSGATKVRAQQLFLPLASRVFYARAPVARRRHECGRPSFTCRNSLCFLASLRCRRYY
jgi:YidC/Oxa1 family membrane protein insertase